MTKVCFINIYQGNALRGAETFVSKLSEKLKKHFEVSIIAGGRVPLNRWPILWRAYLDPQGIQVFIYTLSLLPKIWREKYDLIIPVNGGWMPALVRLVTWAYGGKMLISGQSGVGWDERNNLWCFPDTFVALSSYSQNWARRVTPWVKSLVIPNGVIINDFQHQGKKIMTTLRPPIVLCVAALTQAKRIDLVIKAVARTKDFSLFLVGNPGEYRDELIKLGKALLGKRFFYKNYLHEKMPDVYRSADIFTLVSKSYFSFEIVIVEAMATGLPVVVNNDPIRREIVGDSGYYVNPEEVDDYARILEKALLQKEKTRGKVLERSKTFDWETISNKYKRLIEELVKND